MTQKIHEIIPYILFPSFLYALGITSSIQIGILALCLAMPDGLRVSSRELCDLFCSDERTIRYNLHVLIEDLKLISNQGTKFKKILVPETANLFRLLLSKPEKCCRFNGKTFADFEENLFRFYIKGEKEHKKQPKKEGSSKSFYPPSLDEVQSYINEKGYQVNALQFIEYYSKLGWKDRNGNPVKNWKQKLLTVWVKNNNATGGQRVQSFDSQRSTVGETINV